MPFYPAQSQTLDTLDTGALVNVFSNNVFIQVVFVKISKVYTM